MVQMKSTKKISFLTLFIALLIISSSSLYARPSAPVWFIIDPSTGKGKAARSTERPLTQENEIIVSYEERNIYNRYVKDVFSPKLRSYDDHTASKILAKKYGLTLKKLYNITKKVELLNNAIKKGSIRY